MFFSLIKMSLSTLRTPIIKDVIAELLKDTDSLLDKNTVGKIAVSSKEGLNAFIEFLQEHVQSVSLKVEELSFKLVSFLLCLIKYIYFLFLEEWSSLYRQEISIWLLEKSGSICS